MVETIIGDKANVPVLKPHLIHTMSLPLSAPAVDSQGPSQIKGESQQIKGEDDAVHINLRVKQQVGRPHRNHKPSIRPQTKHQSPTPATLQDGAVTHFRIKPTILLKKLMDSFCQRQSLDRRAVKCVACSFCLCMYDQLRLPDSCLKDETSTRRPRLRTMVRLSWQHSTS